MSTPAERLARKKAFAAPDRKDPLAVCRAYMGRLGLSDWAGAAALVDGRSLQSLKKALIQLLAAEPDSLSLLRSMFPRLKNRGDLEKARAEDVFADFLAKVFGSSEELHTAFSQAAFDILAAAEESPEVRHVVYRYRYVLEGVEHSKVAVAPMSLCDGVWSMKADEDIKGLLNGIAMRKRMLRSFEVPDTDSEDEDEVADEGKDEAENEDVEAAADLVTLLKRLGEESLAMEDLEAEILPLLLSEDNDVVLGGLKLLKPLLSVHSLPRVLEQTTSPDHRVRWHALDCLSEGLRFAPWDIIPALLAGIEKDTEPWVRKKAAACLSRWDDPALLTLLRPFLDDHDLGLVTHLLDAAACTQGTPKLLFLEEVVLSHPEVKIRDYAREKLFEISRPDA